MLSLSKKSDYGLLIVSLLIKSEGFIPLTKLVENTKLPQRFLARISAILAKNDVLISREGRVGGYKLSRRFETMSVYDFVTIFEPHFGQTYCEKRKTKCDFEEICKHKYSIQSKLNTVIVKDLKQVRLKDLFS